MYFATTFVASLVVSASALATPHLAHGLHRRHHHAALAKARAPVPEPAAQPLVPNVAIPKRQLRKRCGARKKSAPSSTETSSTALSAQTPAAADSPSNVAPVNVAPLPDSSSTSSTPDPPKATHTPSPSPSPSPAAASGDADVAESSSLFTGSHLGDGTFYGTGLGACGITNNDDDMICAVSETLFDSYPGYNGVNPNSNPVCNKQITATYQGKSVTVKVTDRCTGCNATSLDFSPKAFNQIANKAIGRIHDVQWKWD